MNDKLPEWYPLANATEAEIEAWLVSKHPPFDEMRQALPWLNKEYQFDAWLKCVRIGRLDANKREVFPGIAAVPLPPRRLAELEVG